MSVSAVSGPQACTVVSLWGWGGGYDHYHSHVPFHTFMRRENSVGWSDYFGMKVALDSVGVTTTPFPHMNRVGLQNEGTTL